MDGSWGFFWFDFQNTKQDVTKSVSGIIHDRKVIGAGFNLLVNATNDDDEEEDDVEPLEWLNCAANKANMANKEMVICSTFYHKYVANIIWRTKELVPFTQLVKVRGGNLVWALPSI